LRAPDGLRQIPGGSVTTPPGFVAGSTACGLKASGALDIGVLTHDGPCTSAVVDTTSALPSAAILHTRSLDPATLRGVVVNAGSANAATGSPGRDDAAQMTAQVEAALRLPLGSIAVSSTGTIGDRLDLQRVLPGIDAAVSSRSADGGAAFNGAICTTDRAPKGGAFALALSGGEALIGAAAKGAGMINPTMATMLAYVTTDAAVLADDLARLTAAAAMRSFNRISVDGQMSPSDTLVIFAGGTGEPLRGPDLEQFEGALSAVCRWLAIQMVKDGEGAEHAVRVLITEARDDEEAERVARYVGGSPLVKTAIFGRDPNWGRVSQAVGQALSGARGEVNEPRLTFDGAPADAEGIEQTLARPEYDLGVALGRGDATAELWVSDLSYAYVELNAEYHT
jgi:glutamate N-acetyltransferase/amino-acid N-acetyltransferase